MLKKYLFNLSCLIALLLLAGNVNAQQTISVVSQTALFNTAADIDINLSNTVQITAVQFDLTVDPSGVILPKVSDEVILSARSDGHSVQVSQINSTTIRVILFSLSNKALKGNSGKLLTIKSRTTNNPGNYPISLSNITIANLGGTNVASGSQGGSFTVLAPKLSVGNNIVLGSIPMNATRNGYLNIQNTGNSNLTISQIKTEGAFLSVQAPVMPLIITPNNGFSLPYSINPTVKGAFSNKISLISNDPSSQQTDVTVTGNVYSVNEINFPSGLTGSYSSILSIPINISNQEVFNAFQFSLNFPAGIEYQTASISLNAGRKQDHVIEANLVNGKLTVIAYSPSLKPFIGTSGEILKLNVKLNNKGGRYSVQITDAVISNASGNNILSGTQSREITISSPELTVYNSQIDFGRITTKETANRTLTLYNTGNEALTVTGLLNPIVGLTFSQSFPFQIAPGSYKTVDFTLSSNLTAIINSDIVFKSNDPVGDKKINVRGTVYSKNELSLKYATGLSNGKVRVPILLTNFDALKGIQFDVRISNASLLKFSETPFKFSSNITGFSVSTQLINQDVLRVLIYSFSGNQLPSDVNWLGELVLTPLNNQSTGYFGNLNFEGLVLADINNINVASGSTNTNVNLCNEVISLKGTPADTFCKGSSVVINPQMGTAVAWYRNDVLQALPYTTINTISAPGLWNAITNYNGCNYWTPVLDVKELEMPVATIIANGPTTFDAGKSVTLTAEKGASYIWSTGETSKSIVVNKGGNYTVTVTNSNGCSSVSTPINVVVKEFTLPVTNFKVLAVDETCRTSNNGKIKIAAIQELNYIATVLGNGVNSSIRFTKDIEIKDIKAGTYALCITVEGKTEYKQCFEVVVNEPKDLAVYSTINKQNNTLNLSLEGGSLYMVELNGELYTTSQNYLELSLSKGSNKLKINTDKECQGVVEKIILNSDDIIIYPNPFENEININLGTTEFRVAAVEVRTIGGKLVFAKQCAIEHDKVQLNLSELSSDVYVLKLSIGKFESFYKILKK